MEIHVTPRVKTAEFEVFQKAPEPQERDEAENLFVDTFSKVDWHGYAPSFLRDAFADEVRAGDDRKWVFCRQGNRLAGFCTYQAKSGEAAVYLAQLAVAVGSQRQRVGTHLMGFVLNQTPAEHALHTIVRRANGPSLTFQEKLGLEPSSYMQAGYDPQVYTGFTWPAGKDRALFAPGIGARYGLAVADAAMCIQHAIQLRDQRRCTEATALLEDRLRNVPLSPKDAGALYHQLGNTLQYAEDFEPALQALENAYQKRRDAGDGVGASYSAFQLAMCWRAKLQKEDPAAGLSPEAMACFAHAATAMQRALASLPANTKTAGDFHHNLAFCLEQQGRFADALEQYNDVLQTRRAADDARGEAYTHNRMAVCYQRLGHFDEALSELDKALDYYRSEKILPRLAAAQKTRDEIVASQDGWRAAAA